MKRNMASVINDNILLFDIKSQSIVFEKEIEMVNFSVLQPIERKKYIYYCSGSKIIKFDLSTKGEHVFYQCDFGDLCDFYIFKNQKKLVTLHSNKRLCILETKNFGQIWYKAAIFISTFIVSEDQSLLYYGKYSKNKKSIIVVYCLKTWKKLHATELAFRVDSLLLNKDEQFISACTIDGIYILETESLTIIASLEYSHECANHAISEDQNHFYVFENASAFHVFDISDIGRLLKCPRNPSKDIPPIISQTVNDKKQHLYLISENFSQQRKVTVILSKKNSASRRMTIKLAINQFSKIEPSIITNPSNACKFDASSLTEFMSNSNTSKKETRFFSTRVQKGKYFLLEESNHKNNDQI
jgi:hypothetical protein